jgi:DNA mismatch repair protein MutS
MGINDSNQPTTTSSLDRAISVSESASQDSTESQSLEPRSVTKKPNNKPKPSKVKPTKDPWDTPAMRQWTTIKKEHPDCVLLFRMGDFYELFGDDAVNLSRDLGLSLTTRGSSIPLAGVPHHQKSVYLQRAIDAGYRVAVVDQLEDPKEAKGVVDRGVTQVVTPGTLVDESLLKEEQTVPLGSLAILDDQHAGIAVVELSTGSFELFNGTLLQCQEQLARLGIREFIFSAPSSGQAPKHIEELALTINASATPRASWQFRSFEAKEIICDVFDVSTLHGFGLDDAMPAMLASGAILRYIKETQAIRDTSRRSERAADETASQSTHHSTSNDPKRPLRQAASLAHISPPTLIDLSRSCIIDAVSLRSLEIEQTIREQSLAGSLAGIFLASPVGTRCVLHTPMGKRMVRSWLASPLIDEQEIIHRQSTVGLLAQESILRSKLIEILKPICDIARIAGRVALGRATPRDIGSLGTSVALIDQLIDTLRSISMESTLGDFADQLEHVARKLSQVADSIVNSCVDEPPAHLRAGGLIRDGVDSQLDDARTLERDAGTWLAKYQQELIAEHDLPSMKVGYNKVFGYYIELPAAQALRAPDIFTRKQTLKNAERYITPELKSFEEKVLTASDRAIERERILFDQLCDRTRSVLPELTAFAQIVATIDCLVGFAIKASERGWCAPKIVDEPTLDIIGGRHPVLDETLGHQFVPNDCLLAHPDSPATLALITGPNMAGKSTYIRQNALLVILAQAGSFIPADSATVGITKRVFTRVGADDALHRGQSTFMVEMIETANILNNADETSLVILDEIGRGTSTLDGLSLAWAICEWLATNKPRTLFATHYHEITELEDRLEDTSGKRVKNLHVAVREWTSEDGHQEIAFLHSIRTGRADQSYGVHVAQLAGVPKAITQRAKDILDTLSVEHAGRVDTSLVNEPARHGSCQQASKGDQLGLFTEYVEHPVVDKIRELKLESMSPMDAFDALRTLLEQVENGS